MTTTAGGRGASTTRSVYVAVATDVLRNQIGPVFGPMLPSGWRLADNVHGVNAIITIDVPVDETMLQAAGTSLQAIGNVDSASTIAPTNVPKIHLPRIANFVVAEYSVLLMLALARKLKLIIAKTEARQWAPGVGTPMLTDQHNYVYNWIGLEDLGVFLGKTVGIVGFGKIGQAVANALRGFGVNVLYTRRSRLPDADEKRLGVEWRSLDDLMRESDFITVHKRFVSGPDGNEHQIGRRELGLMKPSACLVNTSRGRLVDEEALVEALRNRTIGGAGLDVATYEPLPPKHPFFELASSHNLILTAHLAGGSPSNNWRAYATAFFSDFDALQTSR